jgi:hypothetical protein
MYTILRLFIALMNYSEFTEPNKRTQVFTYKYYIFRSDMFRLSKHHLQGARDAKFKTTCQ